MSEDPLDNTSGEWRASLTDWLREGVKIHDRLETEALRHTAEARAKRRLARVLARALQALGPRKADPAPPR